MSAIKFQLIPYETNPMQQWFTLKIWISWKTEISIKIWN